MKLPIQQLQLMKLPNITTSTNEITEYKNSELMKLPNIKTSTNEIIQYNNFTK